MIKNFCSSWVLDSCSILYSSKIGFLQIDWFTGYKGIMIEHECINRAEQP